MIESKKILIVEDDLVSADYLREILEDEDYEVVNVVDNASDAILECKKQKIDIVLMDIMLKGNLSGCEAAVQIRQEHKNNACKVIFLTAYADKEMISYAVSSKAYGYLLKPYREEEILATIQLALSQQKSQEPVTHQNIIELKYGYIFDTKLHRLLKNEKEIPLGKKPLKLIEILAKNKNTSVSNEQIYQHVWGEEKSDCTLRTLIHRIRITIGEDLIKNINGVGYSIA